MLLIGTEQMVAEAVTTGAPNDTVTLVRGLGGTTAAVHLKTAAISRYTPPDEIESLCGMLAARLFQRGTTGWSDITGTRETAQLFIKEMAPEAAYILDLYDYDTWQGDSRFAPWGESVGARIY